MPHTAPGPLGKGIVRRTRTSAGQRRPVARIVAGMSEQRRRPDPHRTVVSVVLLTVAAVALVGYVTSGFAEIPGMVAFFALVTLNLCYQSWQRRDGRPYGMLTGLLSGADRRPPNGTAAR